MNRQKLNYYIATVRVGDCVAYRATVCKCWRVCVCVRDGYFRIAIIFEAVSLYAFGSLFAGNGISFLFVRNFAMRNS